MRQYERDPRPITMHLAGLEDTDTVSFVAAGGGPHDPAELYRIQTEDAWGRWLWLVAELVPDGEWGDLMHEARLLWLRAPDSLEVVKRKRSLHSGCM